MAVQSSSHLERAAGLMRRAAIASVGVSMFLVAIKAFAYFASHSVAMLASLADSALDLFTSSLNLLAIRQSLTPADAEHRFGHGKAEPLAGLAQGAFITASALFLVIQAVNRILPPDPLIAIAVAGVMVYAAFNVGRQSFNQLMDRELPDEERARIRRIAEAHDAVRNVHDLKTRAAGLSTFIQLHLALDPDMRLKDAHQVSDAVEKALQNAYPGADVIIHQDPAGLEPLSPDFS